MQNFRFLYFSQITHDLRTPLISILSLLDKLKDYTHEGRGQKLLKIIKNSSVHMSNLVNDILDMSRIENGKFEVIKEEFNLF